MGSLENSQPFPESQRAEAEPVMEEVFVSHRCPTCGGPSHPATGCAYSSTFIVCYRCTVEAWAWIRQHTAGKGRRSGPSFYDHVNHVSQPIEVQP
jgi:hypothetical protein